MKKHLETLKNEKTKLKKKINFKGFFKGSGKTAKKKVKKARCKQNKEKKLFVSKLKVIAIATVVYALKDPIKNFVNKNDKELDKILNEINKGK